MQWTGREALNSAALRRLGRGYVKLPGAAEAGYGQQTIGPAPASEWRKTPPAGP